MGFDVFISHSSKDRIFADAVLAKLESSDIRCWIAPRDIPPGSDWAEAIMSGISKCRIMVLIFSKNSNESPQVRREVDRAISHNLVILPVRVEDYLPSGSMEYYLSSVHWLDAMTAPFDRHLSALSDWIEHLRQGGANPPNFPAKKNSSGRYVEPDAVIGGGEPRSYSIPALTNCSFAIYEADGSRTWGRRREGSDIFEIRHPSVLQGESRGVAWGMFVSEDTYRFNSGLEHRESALRAKHGPQVSHGDFEDLRTAAYLIGTPQLIDLLELRMVRNPEISPYDGVEYWNQGPFVTYRKSVAEGSRAYFVAVHDRVLVDDWRVIDTINDHDIDLGSWHNNRPILVKKWFSVTDISDTNVIS